MKKLIILTLGLFLGGSMAVSAKKRFVITTGDESLHALTKITDSEEPVMNPFGGDDGKNLFFTMKDKKGYWNIMMKATPGSAATVQKTSGTNRNFSPVYCPAIDKIAFRCQMEGAFSSDIYMIGTAATAFTPITESRNEYEDNPTFTKDGVWLAYDKCSYTYYKSTTWSWLFGFSSNVRLVENSDIWVKNLKTNESLLLGRGYMPCFSPDGKRIAYVKYAADAKSTSIWLMNLDGTNQTQITDAKRGFAFSPKWSPDGKRIIFQLMKKDKKDYDLYIIDADGGNFTQITSNKSSDCQPYWANDNNIYFCSDRGGEAGNYQIWRFKLND